MHNNIKQNKLNRVLKLQKTTFSSRALWCSNRDLRAFNTSTSLDTPEGDEACRLTTVIRSDRSWRATRHSRCSSNNYNSSRLFQCSLRNNRLSTAFTVLEGEITSSFVCTLTGDRWDILSYTDHHSTLSQQTVTISKLMRPSGDMPQPMVKTAFVRPQRYAVTHLPCKVR